MYEDTNVWNKGKSKMYGVLFVRTVYVRRSRGSMSRWTCTGGTARECCQNVRVCVDMGAGGLSPNETGALRPRKRRVPAGWNHLGLVG